MAGGPAATTLAYDPFGRLDSVTAGGATTSFRYAGSQLGGEFNLSSAANYSRQLRIYLYAGGGDTPLLWLEGVTQLSTTLTQTPAWFHTDRLGSVVATTNSSGAVTAYAYGPYGEPQTWAGSRFRYTGQLAIPEAQLYHYRARAYDPMLGRFLQTDPIGYGDGPNIYAYVHGDPVNGTDPSGTCESCIAGPDHLTIYSIAGIWAPGSNMVGWSSDPLTDRFDRANWQSTSQYQAAYAAANPTMRGSVYTRANFDRNATAVALTAPGGAESVGFADSAKNPDCATGACTDTLIVNGRSNFSAADLVQWAALQAERPTPTPQPTPTPHPPNLNRCVAWGVGGGAVTYTTLDWLAVSLDIAAGAGRGATWGALFTSETGPGAVVGAVVGGLVGAGVAVAMLASHSCF